jgi:hypothetical protein
MSRMLSHLITVVSIVSAVVGLLAFSFDYGDWIKEKAKEIISVISPPIAQPPVGREPDAPVDCSAIPEMTNRIFCINKQKERDECAKGNCRSPVKGQAAKALGALEDLGRDRHL